MEAPSWRGVKKDIDRRITVRTCGHAHNCQELILEAFAFGSTAKCSEPLHPWSLDALSAPDWSASQDNARGQLLRFSTSVLRDGAQTLRRP